MTRSKPPSLDVASNLDPAKNKNARKCAKRIKFHESLTATPEIAVSSILGLLFEKSD